MVDLKKVLILSVSAGTGHMRAASALKSAIIEENPAASVTILDTFRYASPLLDKVVLGTYMELLKMTPVVYGYLYRKAEKGQPLSGFMKTEFSRILNKVAANKLIHFLASERPQAVICTHPFPLGIIASLRAKGQFDIPFFATITDFTIHPFWVFPQVDYYLVPADDLRSPFKEYGIGLERVCATGIPIDPHFSLPVDRHSVRQSLGLNLETPTALVMGGGLGMGSLAEAVKALGGGKLPCQLMVVTGNNESLRLRLERLAASLPNNVKVFGFVNNIHELMTAADFLVSKAGGLTCAEAMSKGLPVFIDDPLPGQEERNTDFLVSAGAAIRVNGTENLARAVWSRLEEPGRLRAMSEAAARLGRPQSARAARDIIKQAVNAYWANGNAVEAGLTQNYEVSKS